MEIHPIPLKKQIVYCCLPKEWAGWKTVFFRQPVKFSRPIVFFSLLLSFLAFWFLILHSDTVSQWLSLYFGLVFFVSYFLGIFALFCFFFRLKKSACISCFKKVLNIIHFLLYPKARYDRPWSICLIEHLAALQNSFLFVLLFVERIQRFIDTLTL